MFRSRLHPGIPVRSRLPLLTILLTLVLVAPVRAEDVYDLCVDELHISGLTVMLQHDGTILPASFTFPCTLTATVRKYGDAPIESGLQLHFALDGVDVAQHDLADVELQTFEHVMYNPIANDAMCWVDEGSDEYYGGNNEAMVQLTDGCLEYLYMPDPQGGSDMRLDLQGNLGEKKTGRYPYAFLILPPYDWDAATPGGTMATTLTTSHTEGEATEVTTGVTAGITLSCGFSLLGFESSVGQSVETQWEDARGHQVERTESSTFTATSNAGAESEAEHTVVLTQTFYYMCGYDVTTGSQSGEQVIISVMRPEDPSQNPQLVPCPLDDYQQLVHYDGPNLVAGCVVGDKESYGNSPSPGDHVTGDTVDDNVLVRSERLVSSGGAQWGVTLAEGGHSSKSFNLNLTTTAQFGGLQVTVGSQEGRTHTIFQGSAAAYDFQIGGTNDPYAMYNAGGYVAKVRVVHSETDVSREDGFVLVDYYVKEAKNEKGYGEEAEKEAVNAVNEVMKQIQNPPGPGEAFTIIAKLTRLVMDLVQPQEWWALLLDVMQDIINWLGPYYNPGTYTPYINQAYELAQEISYLISDMIYNPPDPPTWTIAARLVTADLHNLAHLIEWYFHPDPVFVEPALPVAGQTLNIWYNEDLGMHPGMGDVTVDIYVDDAFLESHAMTVDPVHGIWSAETTLPDSAEVVDFIFDLLGNLDDRDGWGWNLPVTGHQVLEHDNGSVVLSVTDRGLLGYTEEASPEGEGFRYPPGSDSLLRLGGFWAGNFGFVDNRDYDADPNADWQPADQEPWGLYRAGDDTIQFTHTAYSDSAGSAAGLVVYQGGVSRHEDPHDDYVILSYHLWNTSDGAMVQLFAGQFADFELAGGGATDLGGTDPTRQLVYMHDGGASPYVGICPLNELYDSTAGLTLIDVGSYSGQGYIPDADKHDYLSGDPLRMEPGPTTPGDWAALVSQGPYTLMPSQVITLAFAVLAGDNLADLQANADSARAFWSSWIPTDPLSNVDGTVAIPTTGLLDRIYPNPFNPNTVLHLRLPADGPVSLEIYDVAGRLVRTLHDGSLQAGEYAFRWDGKDGEGRAVGSGTYFGRLQTSFGNETRKMALVR